MRPDLLAHLTLEGAQFALSALGGLVFLRLHRTDPQQSLSLWGWSWFALAATRLFAALAAYASPVPGAIDLSGPGLQLATQLSSYLAMVGLAAGAPPLISGREIRRSHLVGLGLLALFASALAVFGPWSAQEGYFIRYVLRTGSGAAVALGVGVWIWWAARGAPGIGMRASGAAIAAFSIPIFGYCWATARGIGFDPSLPLDWLVVFGAMHLVGCAAMALAMVALLVEREQLSRRSAQQQLERDRAARDLRFRAVVDQMHDAIVVLDREGRFAGTFERESGVLGYPAEGMRGQSAFDLMHPDDAPRARAAIAALAAEPSSSLTIEVRVRRLDDGQWADLECRAKNCMHIPSLGGILVTAQNLSERRQLERRLVQAERLESVGRLAGGLAHDFNNLLTVVSGNASLLRGTLSADAPAQEWLAEIEQATDRGARLSQQLLTFAGRQPVAPRLLNLDELVRGLLPLIRRLVGETIAVDFEPARDAAVVRADPSRIEQVVMNLAANARDAMPEGGRLSIATQVENAPAGEGDSAVRLVISDTGSGISEELRQHIFEPFFTTRQPGEGRGLGLATAYGIVEQAGGRIDVDSRPGQGSSFSVRLPLARGEPESRASGVAAMTGDGSETVLVVEDEALVRQVAVRGLQARGYRVLEACDGEEALAALAGESGVRCVISDVVMPRLGGSAFSRTLEQRFPDLPVLFVSGYAPEFGLEGQRRHSAFIRKPYSPDELVAQLRRLLDEHPRP